MNSLIRLLAIMHKEVRQLRRDRLTLGMIVGIPLLQITLFGFAINTDVRYLTAGVANQSASQLARWLVADAEASQVIRIVRQVDTPEQLENLIRRGDIAVGLFIPEDFTRRLQDPEHRPAAQLLIDGSDPLILAAARQLSAMETLHRIEAPRKLQTPTFAIRPYFNPERRSALYIVPGLMGV
ncbi:ABC transporter permease, partial [Candidatus Woesearchaeota archaeon]|nr:ABC transporter permease [Candidatus Woesearchaeota archaeon]